MSAHIRLDTRTVSCGIAHQIWHALQAKGVAASEFTAQTGIALDALAQPHGRLNVDQHRRCTAFASEFEFKPDLLDMGWKNLFEYFPTVANLCANSATLRMAMNHLLEFRGLIGEFDYLLLNNIQDTLSFEYIAEFPGNRSVMPPLANFVNLAVIARCYDVGRPSVFQVGFAGPAPAFHAEINAFFGARVRFDQPANTLTFTAPHIDAPFAHFNRVLAPWAQKTARDELAQLRQTHCFSAGVERLILEQLGMQTDRADSESLMQLLCRKLNTTRWTLNRQLQAEGTSFKNLEQKIKVEESRRLLRDTQLSLAEISEQLGFSTQSAFTRFFKACYTVPPASYRNAIYKT